MSVRAATWLAWSVWALCVALTACSVLLLSFLSSSTPVREGYPFYLEVVFGGMLLAYPTVGALIASRHPGNPIGWIFCAAGLLIVVPTYATLYAPYSLFARSAPLPGTQYMAWVSDSDIVIPGMLAILELLLLLYPSGRLLSREWRVVVWMSVCGSVLWSLQWATSPGSLYRYPSIENPFGVGGGAGLVVEALGNVGILLLVIAFVVSGLSWVSRWERAEGVERQQLKWFAYGLFAVVISMVYPWFLTPLALAFLPIAAGIAIFKYRLYDIDIIINRTLVYGALTALLAGAYLGCVVLFQDALRALTGRESDLAVVASTLSIAAVFNPLRRRIQTFIDRIFYRNKYDAQKTLAAFGDRLREDTDLESLSRDFVAVTRETLHPEHVSLWLREPERDRKPRADG